MLADNGLALENLGDIAYQSIAGATSTATHGTGLRFGNLSSRIVGMRLIAGDGSVVEADADHHPDVFDVARVGVGALGLLSTVTVASASRPSTCMPWSASSWSTRCSSGGRTRSPATTTSSSSGSRAHGWALTKRNQRTQEPVRPRPRWRAWRDDYLLTNVAFDAVCRVGRLRPDLIPRAAKLVPSVGPADYIAPSHVGLRQPAPGQVLRDGVRHRARAPGRGPQPGAGAGALARACPSASRSRCGWWPPTTSR